MQCCNKDQIDGDVTTNTPKTARAVPHHICPSKLSKRELEDVYFSLMENNLDLKRMINNQSERLKALSTKMQRMTNTQKAYLGIEMKECCASAKTAAMEQKLAMQELKRLNMNLEEQVRQLNMKLCSTKQFLKRPALTVMSVHTQKSMTRSVSARLDTGGKKTASTNAKTEADHLKKTYKSVSCECLEELAKVANMTSTGVDTKDLPWKLCDENKCRTQMDELKREIATLQEELKRHNSDYSERINHLEREVIELQLENSQVKVIKSQQEQTLEKVVGENKELVIRLLDAENRCDDLEASLKVEKGKSAELEAQLKATNIANKTIKAYTGHVCKHAEKKPQDKKVDKKQTFNAKRPKSVETRASTKKTDDVSKKPNKGYQKRDASSTRSGKGFQKTDDSSITPSKEYQQRDDSSTTPSKGYQQNIDSSTTPIKGYQQKDDSYTMPSKVYQLNDDSSTTPIKGYQQKNDSSTTPSKGYQQNDSSTSPSETYQHKNRATSPITPEIAATSAQTDSHEKVDSSASPYNIKTTVDTSTSPINEEQLTDGNVITNVLYENKDPSAIHEPMSSKVSPSTNIKSSTKHSSRNERKPIYVELEDQTPKASLCINKQDIVQDIEPYKDIQKEVTDMDTKSSLSERRTPRASVENSLKQDDFGFADANYTDKNTKSSLSEALSPSTTTETSQKPDDFGLTDENKNGMTTKSSLLERRPPQPSAETSQKPDDFGFADENQTGIKRDYSLPERRSRQSSADTSPQKLDDSEHGDANKKVPSNVAKEETASMNWLLDIISNLQSQLDNFMKFDGKEKSSLSKAQFSQQRLNDSGFIDANKSVALNNAEKELANEKWTDQFLKNIENLQSQINDLNQYILSTMTQPIQSEDFSKKCTRTMKYEALDPQMSRIDAALHDTAVCEVVNEIPNTETVTPSDRVSTSYDVSKSLDEGISLRDNKTPVLFESQLPSNQFPLSSQDQQIDSQVSPKTPMDIKRESSLPERRSRQSNQAQKLDDSGLRDANKRVSLNISKENTPNVNRQLQNLISSLQAQMDSLIKYSQKAKSSFSEPVSQSSAEYSPQKLNDSGFAEASKSGALNTEERESANENWCGELFEKIRSLQSQIDNLKQHMKIELNESDRLKYYKDQDDPQKDFCQKQICSDDCKGKRYRNFQNVTTRLGNDKRSQIPIPLPVDTKHTTGRLSYTRSSIKNSLSNNQNFYVGLKTLQENTTDKGFLENTDTIRQEYTTENQSRDPENLEKRAEFDQAEINALDQISPRGTTTTLKSSGQVPGPGQAVALDARHLSDHQDAMKMNASSINGKNTLLKEAVVDIKDQYSKEPATSDIDANPFTTKSRNHSQRSVVCACHPAKNVICSCPKYTEKVSDVTSGPRYKSSATEQQIATARDSDTRRAKVPAPLAVTSLSTTSIMDDQQKTIQSNKDTNLTPTEHELSAIASDAKKGTKWWPRRHFNEELDALTIDKSAAPNYLQLQRPSKHKASLKEAPILEGASEEQKVEDQNVRADKGVDQLQICEEFAHICNCPRKRRRDVAVFRSCSGTLRFRTVSNTESTFRRCGCRNINARNGGTQTASEPPLLNKASLEYIEVSAASQPHVSRGTSPENTDKEISSMTDLPSENNTPHSSPRGYSKNHRQRSPGETNARSTETDTVTFTTSSTPYSKTLEPSTLSEGEVPQLDTEPHKFCASRERGSDFSNGQAPIANRNVQSPVQESTTTKVEQTLQAISAEIARCQNMLLATKAQEVAATPTPSTNKEENTHTSIIGKTLNQTSNCMQQAISKNRPAHSEDVLGTLPRNERTSDNGIPAISRNRFSSESSYHKGKRSRDSSISLHAVTGKAHLGGPLSPRVMFIIHIGTMVLSDEAVINFRDLNLVLTFKFYDQNVAMSHVRPGRVVHFDFSTEYDLKLTDDLLDYLKNEELTINICGVDNLDTPMASCYLPLREPLLHTNRHADMSLALLAGPRRPTPAANAVDMREEMGVLDLWCMLRADTYVIPQINKAIARSTKRATSKRDEKSAAGPTSTQMVEDNGRVSNGFLYLKPDIALPHRDFSPNVRTPSEMKEALERRFIPDMNDSRKNAFHAERRKGGNLDFVNSTLERSIIPNTRGNYSSLEVTGRESSGNISGRRGSQLTELEHKYGTVSQILGTNRGANSFAKRVKMDSSAERFVDYTPDVHMDKPPDYIIKEQLRNQTIDITILWLALNEECQAMSDPSVQRLYVAYSFLGRGGADLETPTSLPKPKNCQDKCYFNFRKSFQLSNPDIIELGRLAQIRSNKRLKANNDCIVFTVVSEPMEDPLGLNNCVDIGTANLYFGDLLEYSAGSDSYTEVIPIRAVRPGDGICGVLAIKYQIKIQLIE